MEVARHWRLNNQRYKLQGSICTCCGKTFFGPRLICDSCSTNQTDVYQFSSQIAYRETIEAAYVAGK